MLLADPNCPICHGEGQIWSDGETIVPIVGKPCECVLRIHQAELVARRLEAANIPERYREASVERFHPRDGVVIVHNNERNINEEIRLADIDARIASRVADLAAHPLNNGETVAFIGPFGSGKTYLACALLIAQIRHHGKTGFYITSFDYIHAMLPEGAEPERQRALRETSRTVDILLIDDLGIEKGSAFAMRELWSLINDRTANNRSILVTSNMRIADALQVQADPNLPGEAGEAAEIGRRIFSRLAEVLTTTLVWPEGTRDYRKERGRKTRARSMAAEREWQRRLRGSLVNGGILDDAEADS